MDDSPPPCFDATVLSLMMLNEKAFLKTAATELLLKGKKA
jgi:hypothetical protein